MEENTTRQEPEAERSPRDSQDSSTPFGDDLNAWAWHSDVVFDELLLPDETMEELERDALAAFAAVESAQERLEELREGRDGLIVAESQHSEEAEIRNVNTVERIDPEENQLHERLIALLEQRSFYTPEQDFESTLERGYNAFYERLEDDPSLPRFFQQAIAGLTRGGGEPDQTFTTTNGISEQGLIPITTPSTVQRYIPEPSTTPEPNPLSQNLLGILERPSFISSPLPRWTAPPQWLQFQTLQSYDDGLMTDESQNTTRINAYSTYTEETRTQIQTNFQGLLQGRSESNSYSPPQRWQQPEQWLQSSLEDDVAPPRFAARVGGRYDDGLITAPPRVNDPTSTPSVTCSFGLMQTVGYGERSLEFFPEVFSAIDAPFFRNRVRVQASNTTDLMFIVITDWQPWFRKSLQEALPDFPIDTLSNFNSPQVSSMLPSIDYNEGELTCIMEHINSHRKPREKIANEREIDVGAAKAQCLPLVVWTRALGAIDSHPDRPVIVVISKRTDKMSSKIINHYSNDRYKRWDRLAKNQAWIYLDLYFLFTKWDRIWAAVKRQQQKRTEEVYARQNVLPILQQTRQLHKDNNIMISLREHVRIHKASLRIVMQRVEHMLGGVDFLATQGLKGRLDDAYQLLEYYEVTATTLLEQQQNLLSLAFNLETIAQGAAVARLNALAFVFLPLSFVASVFGITTMTAPPVWYPVAAVPVLLSTIVIAYVANKLFTSQTMKESVTETEVQPYPSDDLEKMPTTTPVVSSLSWMKISKRMRRRTVKISGPIPIPGTFWASQPTSVNDPSRLIRRSTDRSLAGQSYVPPRSTVQYIPGAYDLSSVGPSLYSPPSQNPGSASYNYTAGGSASMPYLEGPYFPVSQVSSTYYPEYYDYGSNTSATVTGNQVTQPYELGNTTVAPAPPQPIPGAYPTTETDRVDSGGLTDHKMLYVAQARALFDLNSDDDAELNFKVGDIITLTSEEDPYDGWAYGRHASSYGMFPRSYVEIIGLVMEAATPPPTTSTYIPYSPAPASNQAETTIPPTSATYSPQDSDRPNEDYYGESLYPSPALIVPPGEVGDDSRVVVPLPSTIAPVYHENGDSTGYRPDAPDSFGLPPEGFSTSFAGKTLDDQSASSAPPASRRFGVIFGGLDEVVMGSSEASGTLRLEPIPEEEDEVDIDEAEAENIG